MKDGKIILDLRSYSPWEYEVQREFHGYRWEVVARYVTQVAAFAKAEELHEVTGDPVRVVKIAD